MQPLFLNFLHIAERVPDAIVAIRLRAFPFSAKSINLFLLFLLPLPGKIAHDPCDFHIILTSFPYLTTAYEVLHHEDIV